MSIFKPKFCIFKKFCQFSNGHHGLQFGHFDHPISRARSTELGQFYAKRFGRFGAHVGVKKSIFVNFLGKNCHYLKRFLLQVIHKCIFLHCVSYHYESNILQKIHIIRSAQYTEYTYLKIPVKNCYTYSFIHSFSCCNFPWKNVYERS